MKKEILLGPLILLAIWGILSYTELVDTLFLPEPHKVVIALYNLFSSGPIYLDLLKTVYRVALGFVIGLFLGVPLGLIMGSSEKIHTSLEITVDFFRSLPALALFPLFLIVFGIGDKAKIAMAVWATALIILINTMYGVKACKQTRIRVAKTMRANQWQVFTKVIFPSALPEIFTGIRVAISLALIVVIVSEMFTGTKWGLGQRIYNTSLLYKVSQMYAAIIITGLLGYFLNKIFMIVEKRVVHWAGK